MISAGVAYLVKAAGNTLIDSSKNKKSSKKPPAKKKAEKVKKEKPGKVEKTVEPVTTDAQEEPDDFNFDISMDEGIDYGEDEPEPEKEKAPEPQVQGQLEA